MPTKRPAPSAKNVQGDFGKFADFMRKLVAIPHSEIKAKVEAEKRTMTRRKKRASGHASHVLHLAVDVGFIHLDFVPRAA